MNGHPTQQYRVRLFEIGGPDSFICAGFALALNYSPRTRRHWHLWLRIGDHGCAWERPRYNR